MTNGKGIDWNAVSSLPAQAALVERMLRGEDKAWREFHANYHRLIYRCISKVTSRFSSTVSTEEMGEIYSMFLDRLIANDMKKLRTFDPTRGNRLGSWLGMLAVNCAYDHLRSLRRRDQNLAPLDLADEMSDASPSPCENLERKQRIAIANELLAAFPNRDREFLMLYCEGLSAEEIAERLQIGLKTVYSRKHKIQSRLGAIIEGARLAA